MRTRGLELLPEFPIDPWDGYRVSDDDMGHLQLGLALELFREGAPADVADEARRVPLWTCPAPCDADYARRSRLQLVLQAVTDYVNAGGSRQELQEALGELLPRLPEAVGYGDFVLYDVYVDRAGQRVTVWRHPDRDEFVRWVDRDFVEDGLTLSALEAELDEEDDEDGEVRCPPDPVPARQADGGDAGHE